MLCTNTDLDTLISRLDEDTTETPYLILGGFQSIRLPAALPIRPLSLLYGPNSSGKSAIGDALRYLEWDLDSEDRKAGFDRWLNNQSEEITIGFSWLGNLGNLVQSGGWGFLGFYGDLLKDAYDLAEDELPFEETAPFRITWLIRDGDTPERIVYLYAREAKVASLSLDSWEHTDFNVYRSGIERLGASEPNVRWLWKLLSRIRYRNNPLDENEFHVFEEDSECLGVDWANMASSRGIMGKPVLRFGYTEDDPLWMENVSDLMRVFFSRPILGISGNLDASGLGAIRPVLGEAELKFLCQGKRAGISLLSPSEDTNRIWRILADDIAEEALAKKQNKTNSNSKSLLADVNRWLNDESFFGIDYCLQADVSEIVSLGIDDAPSRILVEFWLRNGVGKKLSFNDVGTGFSQILPIIICALNGKKTLFVEQPELHLHPRVQHRLADLFIESIRRERCKFCIIETHSEHIALRILKRIRETGRSDIPHSRWSLKPDEVSVLYFEPEGGQTFIHELRIDSTGEFIDKWPRGFFEERYEDLFDVPRMGD
jgi:predicted ATPase